MKACELSGAGQRRGHVGGEDGGKKMYGKERGVDNVLRQSARMQSHGCSGSACVSVRVSERERHSMARAIPQKEGEGERERRREGERERGREGERERREGERGRERGR